MESSLSQPLHWCLDQAKGSNSRSADAAGIMSPSPWLESTLLDTPKTTNILILTYFVVAAGAHCTKAVQTIDLMKFWSAIRRKGLTTHAAFVNGREVFICFHRVRTKACPRWADVSGQYLNSLFWGFAMSFGRDPSVSSLTSPSQFHHNSITIIHDLINHQSINELVFNRA